MELGPIATRALQWLGSYYDPDRGITRDDERTRALLVVRALLETGEPLTPDAARRWASANGWRYVHARDLGDMVQTLIAGDRPPLAAWVRVPEWLGLVA